MREKRDWRDSPSFLSRVSKNLPVSDVLSCKDWLERSASLKYSVMVLNRRVYDIQSPEMGNDSYVALGKLYGDVWWTDTSLMLDP